VRSRRCAPLLVGVLLALILSVRAAGQAPQTQVPNPGFPSQGAAPDQETQDRIQKEMAKKANQERQALLKRDTEHLFKLATELKQYVDKTNENTMSVEVIRKAEEIEKLARSVKDKMKGQ
jgi:membrane protein involved in colicin uptake